jgi:hypothetical protein
MDFTTRTKEDFEAMDARRAEVFAPTPEEQEQQEAEMLSNRIAFVKGALEKYDIPFTWEEEDFAQLWEWYLMGWPTGKSLPMNEWIGNEEVLADFTQNKKDNHNSLEAFMSFVIQYE